MTRNSASKKQEEYGDRIDHGGNRKRGWNRDTILEGDESGKEKKRSKRESGDEITKGPRIYHKDENEPSSSRRRANRSDLERDSKYQYERFGRYERYWDKNDTGCHHEKKSNDRYQSKCLAPKGTNSRNGDTDSTSRGKEKKVKSDSVQNRNINTKYDSQEDAVTNTSSPQQKRTVDLLTSRTGGAYIPPAKLRLMQAQITDKSSAAYQRIAWEALKKSIHGHINKVNTGNIAIIVRELLKENIVRGRGLLCRSIIQAQAASPSFTHVYAALVAVINSKVRLM
jgi:pre-mRNA-splicing factor CWC22